MFENCHGVPHYTAQSSSPHLSCSRENYFSLLTLNTTVCVWNTAHLSGTHGIWIASVNPFHAATFSTVVIGTGSSIWLHKMLATSLLNCILWEQQAQWCWEVLCWTASLLGGPLHWGLPVQTEGVRAILVKHSLIKTVQATQLTNQYVVIWSTLPRSFWTFINKTKQQ